MISMISMISVPPRTCHPVTEKKKTTTVPLQPSGLPTTKIHRIWMGSCLNNGSVFSTLQLTGFHRCFCPSVCVFGCFWGHLAYVLWSICPMIFRYFILGYGILIINIHMCKYHLSLNVCLCVWSLSTVKVLVTHFVVFCLYWVDS